MNRIACTSIVGVMLAGCGLSHAERTAEFIADLKASPVIAIEAKFGEKSYQGELSKAGVERFCQVIAAAQADHNPAKYVVLGSITYPPKADGSREATLVYISEQEAGLRIDGKTYLRKISRKDLEAICQGLISKSANK